MACTHDPCIGTSGIVSGRGQVALSVLGAGHDRRGQPQIRLSGWRQAVYSYNGGYSYFNVTVWETSNENVSAGRYL